MAAEEQSLEKARVVRPASPTLTSLASESALWECSAHPSIVIADDAEVSRRLLRGMLKASPYRIFEARRVSEVVTLMERESIDLVIADLMLPSTGGTDLCRRIRDNRSTHLVPVLLLSSIQGIENEIAGISSGADEFLLKPLHPAVVRARVRALLRHKTITDSLEEAESILFALAQTVEQRDQYTGGHCQRLATYSVALGMALVLAKNQLLALHRGGYLHDIGKIAIPDAVLHKRDSLTEGEWELMRSHTIKGEEICRTMKSLAPVLPIIRSHHERWDGSGYPDALAGEDIPLLARVLQVADVYDALTTARSYKTPLPHEQALEMMEEEARRGWRDPELVSLFCELWRSVSEPGNEEELFDWPEVRVMQRSLENMRRRVGG